MTESEFFSEEQSAVLKLSSLSNLNLNQNSEETGHQLLTSALDEPRATYYEDEQEIVKHSIPSSASMRSTEGNCSAMYQTHQKPQVAITSTY